MRNPWIIVRRRPGEGAGGEWRMLMGAKKDITIKIYFKKQTNPKII